MRIPRSAFLSTRLAVALVGGLGAIVAAIITILPYLWPRDASGDGTDSGPLGRPTILILERVAIEPTREDGEAWDGDEGPDLMVRIVNQTSKQEFISNVRANSTEADFNVQTVRVLPGDTLEVTVLDQDLTNFDDVVGQRTQQVTEAMIAEETVDWASDRVNSLRLRFVRN